MSWADIRSLSSQLKKLQTASYIRISERDCVSIVHQLVSSFDVEIYHSSDGTAVITPEQLVKEIYHELHNSRGHLDITQLESRLNVDRFLIHNSLNQMIQADPTLLLISHDSYLISNDAVNQILQQIEDYAVNKGSTTVEEIALLFKLPTKHFMKILNRAQVASFSIKYDPRKGLIQSTVYLERLRSKLRGFLHATICPVEMKQIASCNDIKEEIALSLIEDLISSDKIDGQLIQNKTLYQSGCYQRAVYRYCLNSYSNDFYISYEDLLRILMKRDYCAYLVENFPNAISLMKVCINPTYFENRTETILPLLTKFGWIDVMNHTPSPDTDYVTSDYEKLIVHLLGSYSSYMIINNHYVISSDCYSSLCSSLESKFSDKMLLLSESMSKTAMLEKLFLHNFPRQSKNLGHLKSSSVVNSSSACSSPVTHKRRSKLSRSTSRRCHESCSPSPIRKQSRVSDPPGLISFMSSQELEKHVVQYFHHNYQTEIDMELALGLTDKLLSDFSVKFRKFIQDQLSGTRFSISLVLDIPNDRLTLEEKIVYLFARLKLYEKNLNYFESQRSDLRFCLNSSEMKDLLTCICQYINRYILPNSHQSDKEKVFETYPEQLYLASRLDFKIGEALNEAISSVHNENVQIKTNFTSLEALLSIIDIKIPELSRKLEQTINSTTNEAFLQEVQVKSDKLSSLSEKELSDLLGICFSLIFFHYQSKLVPSCSQSRIWSIYVDCVRPHLSTDENLLLVEAVDELKQFEQINNYDSFLIKIKNVIRFVSSLNFK